MPFSTFTRALVITLGLCAASATFAQEDVIRATLTKRIPEFKSIDEIRKTNIPGLYEVRANKAEIYYTDAKGNYLLNGNMFETTKMRNLTEDRISKLTAIKFADLPFEDAFTIVRGNGQRKVAVFEDPNCGYCKRFERDLQKVDNVTIYMFLYPILGNDSIDKSKAIWCAKDRVQAWQDWMVRDQSVPAAQSMCDTTALQRNVDFGRTYRIEGTPTLIFSNGKRIPGAIGAQKVEEMLAESKG